MHKLVIDIRPHPIALPFHRLFTAPVVDIDGIETPAAWGTTDVRTEAGWHDVRVFFRYRGQRKARLGEGRTHFAAEGSASHTRLKARLGARNGSSFRITSG